MLSIRRFLSQNGSSLDESFNKIRVYYFLFYMKISLYPKDDLPGNSTGLHTYLMVVTSNSSKVITWYHFIKLPWYQAIPLKLFKVRKSSALSQSHSWYIYIYIIIIIIMSCRQHGYPWPSLATSPYHSSPPAGLQSYILCPHIVAVCKFELVVLLLHIHMWGSIGVHRLWARPCFFSSVLRVWFV